MCEDRRHQSRVVTTTTAVSQFRTRVAEAFTHEFCAVRSLHVVGVHNNEATSRSTRPTLKVFRLPSAKSPLFDTPLHGGETPTFSKMFLSRAIKREHLLLERQRSKLVPTEK